MVKLLAEVKQRLATAEAQKEKLVESGAWAKRLPFMIADYDEQDKYLRNFARMLEAAIERDQKEASGQVAQPLSKPDPANNPNICDQ